MSDIIKYKLFAYEKFHILKEEIIKQKQFEMYVIASWNHS